MPVKESNRRKAILVLGADKETGALLSRCLSELELKMCGSSKEVADAKENYVAVIAASEEKPEPLTEAIRATGVKELRFIWCLCNASEELEDFFPRQPADEVLVIDPDHFRKNVASGCDQLREFCKLDN